jgi:hypothetical protein
MAPREHGDVLADDEGLRRRIDGLDWPAIGAALDADGFARTPPLLTPAECVGMAALFRDDRRFRSRVSMERYRFGVGDYAYFAHPLPPLVDGLRQHLYRRVAPLANHWADLLGEAGRYPPELADFLARCHAAGQVEPTPLLLRYGPGGYNCLHQDLYGPLVFPLQVTCFLSRPGVDFEGGAFLLVEQRPRQQSRGEAIDPGQGELVIFPSALRPVPGRRGFLRARLRHGVSRVLSGERTTLGIIFHDAR